QARSARRAAEGGSEVPRLTGTCIGTGSLSRSWQLPDPRSVEAVRRAHLAIASPFQTRRPQEHDRAMLWMLLGKLPMQTKQVLLFTRKAALDTDHLHRFVYVRVFHVADGAGNVEYELQYIT